MPEILQTDVLVIGGGGAGARAAIEASEYKVSVTIANKGIIGETGMTAVSAYMGPTERLGHGGMFWPSWDPETAALRIINNGEGMNDIRLARILTYEAKDRAMDLKRFGFKYDPSTGRIMEGKGSEYIVTSLKSEMIKRGVNIRENIMITDLLTNMGEVVGAIGINMKTLDIVIFEAKATVLATGSAGVIYKHHISTPCLTGDGYAMAYRAGAELVNMEFMRMSVGETLSPVKGLLFINDIWGLKPRIYNKAHEEFLKKYVPSEVNVDDMFNLMGLYFKSSNDSKYISIAVYKEITEGRGTKNGGVYVDFTDIPEEVIKSKTRGYNWMLSKGIDICKTPVEIVPSIHGFYGGPRIDEKTQTTVPGLFAAGEVAYNVHGADRVAGTALIGCQVLGARAGKYAAIRALSKKSPGIDQRQLQETAGTILIGKGHANKGIKLKALMERVQAISYRYIHIARNEEGLQKAIREFEECKKVLQQADVYAEEVIDAHAIKNMIEVGEMIAKSALLRRESRAVHYREDYPKIDNENWLKIITVKRVAEQMILQARPPSEAYV